MENSAGVARRIAPSGRRRVVLAQSGVERRRSLSRYAGSLLCTPPALSSALPRRLFPRFPGAIPHAKPALVSKMRLNSPPHYAGTLRSTTPALSPAWPRSSVVHEPSRLDPGSFRNSSLLESFGRRETIPSLSLADMLWTISKYVPLRNIH